MSSVVHYARLRPDRRTIRSAIYPIKTGSICAERHWKTRLSRGEKYKFLIYGAGTSTGGSDSQALMNR
jgi:hypothetical protein